MSCCLNFLSIFIIFFVVCCVSKKPPLPKEEISRFLNTQRQTLLVSDQKTTTCSGGLQDVYHYLQARTDTQDEGSRKTWHYLQAIKSPSLPLAEKAFQLYLTSILVRQAKKKVKLSLSEITDLVLEQLKQIPTASYLHKKKFFEKRELMKALVLHNPTFFQTIQSLSKLEEKHVDTATTSCQINYPNPKEKNTEKLNSYERLYHLGLQKHCLRQYKEAKHLLMEVLRQLPDKEEKYLLNISKKLITWERRTGSRKHVADVYEQILVVWEKREKAIADKRSFNEILNFVHYLLWSARYQALIKNYPRAEQHVFRAQKNLKQLVGTKTLSNQQKSKKYEYTADSYHILSFRIAVNQKKYRQALLYTEKAKNLEGLDDEWKQRFLWQAGLYSFLLKDYYQAIHSWGKLLEKTKQDSWRAKLYYWLSVAYGMTHHPIVATEYKQRLQSQFPLSYYTIVALTWSGSPSYSSFFLNKFKEKPNTSAPLKYLVYKQLEEEGFHKLKRFFCRSDGILPLKDQELSNFALQDVQEMLSNRLLATEESAPIYIYLSRLQNKAKLYLKSIRTTTNLSSNISGFWDQWPEQLKIYFPRPYNKFFLEEGKNQFVNKNQLFAISRQESAFDKEAVSSSYAYGLMQIIIPTAKKLLNNGEAQDDILSTLLDPQLNIRLGSRYIQALQKKYSDRFPLVYAAYNAGEYAVDQWLSVNKFSENRLLWVELIPYGETRRYVKNVWRNFIIYEHLSNVL